MQHFIRILITILVFTPILSFSQNNCNLSIKGRIIDKDTNLPISSVNVHVQPININIKTDGHGFFTIKSLCKGEYTLTISSIGFITKTVSIVLNENYTPSYYLEHDDIVLHDVQVIGHQQRLQTTASSKLLSKSDLALTKGKGLAEILTAAAGVTMLQTGSTISKPVIHGMHSNRVLMMNNGIKQEDQQWGSEHAPEIDPFIASSMQVIKGAESVRYGAEAIGGVVLIEPAPLPINTPLQGNINLVGNSNGRGGTASALLEGSIDKIPGLAWRAQGTFKRSGNIKTPNYYLNNTSVKETNFSTTLNFRSNFGVLEAYYSHFNTDLGIFSGAHIGSLADLEARIEHGRPFEEGSFDYKIAVPKQSVIHDLVKLKFHHDYDDGSKLDIKYGFQRNARKEYDLRREGRSEIPAMNLVLHAHQLDLSYDKNTANDLRSTIGINSTAIVNNHIPGTFAIPLVPNYDTYGLGVFLINRLVKEGYELEAGVRYDYKTLDAAGYDKNGEWYGGKRKFNNFSGSLGAVWYLNPQLNLRSNLGLAWRPPTVNELYSNGLHHGSASIEIGNEDFISEQGYKWINTLSWTNDRINLEVNGYAHYLKNYIYINPTDEFEESLRGTFPVFAYRQTNALFYGIDLSTTVELSNHIAYELNGSFVNAKDQTNDQYLPLIPSKRIDNALKWTINHSSDVLVNPFIRVKMESVFKQNRYEEGSDFLAPPPTYNLLSLMAGTTYLIDNNRINFNFTIENILNTEYKEYMNRFRYYAHESGRNFSLRLTYEF